MSRNTGLASVGGALVLSALQGMEANAVRHARHDVLLRVDRSLVHARRQVTHASRTATMLVGVALVAYVVKDQRRARIEARATADAEPTLAARVKCQFRRVTDLIATDVRFVTARLIPKASVLAPLDRVGPRARWPSDLAATLGRNEQTMRAATGAPDAESVTHPGLQRSNPA